MKRNRLFAIAVALTAGLSLLSGCEKAEAPLPKIGTTEPPPPQAEVKPENASGTAAASQSERESTLRMARQEIDQLKAKVDALRVKAQDASAAMKEGLTMDIQGFDQELKELEAKLSALKDAGASAWQDMKASFAASIDKLKGSVEKSGQRSNATGSSY